MNTTRSSDGATIAFERVGQGPPVVTVMGAFNDHATAAPLAAALAGHFSVYVYDRRGRGQSTDSSPYTVEREIEDLEAVMREAGETSGVFGFSSGGVLALKAAANHLPITKLAVYEPPIRVDESRPPMPEDFIAHIAELLAQDRRGEAVEYFQSEGIGLPPETVARLRNAPFRPALEAIAHTLLYDAIITGDLSLPKEQLASVTIPTLVLDGEASPAWMRNGSRAVADALPSGRELSLEGQVHHLVPEVLAPVLIDFFSS